MTDEEAIAECERWFRHLERQHKRTEKLQRLAALARQGPGQAAEAQAEMRRIDRCSLTVYDGSRLADAVRHLVRKVLE